MIEFDSDVEEINGVLLVRLPADASSGLPSRGQVAVTGSLDGREFSTVIDPDGRKGHWIRLDRMTPPITQLGQGYTAKIALEVADEWPEPQVPDDLRGALDGAEPSIRDIWSDITPMARWEWVRWVDATANPATRQRRVDVTISKMANGKRRPCCFNLAACTDPAVSASGKLRP